MTTYATRFVMKEMMSYVPLEVEIGTPRFAASVTFTVPAPLTEVMSCSIWCVGTMKCWRAVGAAAPAGTMMETTLWVAPASAAIL